MWSWHTHRSLALRHDAHGTERAQLGADLPRPIGRVLPLPDESTPKVQAEQLAAADAFQRPLRSRFQARLSRSVGRTAMAGNITCALSVMERCMSGDGQALHTDKLTLQTILHMGYEAYARTHALPDYVRRAV